MPSRHLEIEGFSTGSVEVFTFGTGKGPSVLVTAGLHGDEQTAVFAARRLAAHLTAQKPHGTVKVVPVANPAAFRHRQRTSPFDGLDLNRVFPGQPTGSPTQVLAHRLWQEAQGMDCVVDLHCCGLWGTSYTLALHEQFRYARDLASRLNIPVVVHSSGQRGQLFVEACYAGIPAVIIELPGGQPDGVVDVAAGNRACAALVGLLQDLEMLPGPPPACDPAFFGRLIPVCTERQGLFTPAVAPGAPVRAGDTLGHLDDQPVLAPEAGLVIRIQPARYLFPGDDIASVAPGPR